MNGNHFWVIVVLIIIIAGGWFFLSGTSAKAPMTETPIPNQMPVIGSTPPETVVENTTPSITVAYTDKGFSPESVTIPLGTTVTFVNQSSNKMWVASAMHPTHVVYSGTSLSQHCPDTANSAFDECTAAASGNSFSFTFNKAGTWKYHNHVNSSQTGTVIVTETAPTAAPIPQ